MFEAHLQKEPSSEAIISFEKQLKNVSNYFNFYESEELTDSDLEMVAGNLGAESSICGGGCCSCGFTNTR